MNQIQAIPNVKKTKYRIKEHDFNKCDEFNQGKRILYQIGTTPGSDISITSEGDDQPDAEGDAYKHTTVETHFLQILEIPH
jgi:hypothetical protein